MHLHKISVSKDQAWKSVRSLGDTKSAHFININKDALPFNLPYFSQLKRCDQITTNIDAIISECKGMLGQSQVKPQYIEEFDDCVALLAQEKRRGLSELLEGIEKDVASKLEFINGQKTQLKNMVQEFEYLVEQRAIIEKAKEVIFGRREVKTAVEEIMSGDTDAIGKFIDSNGSEAQGGNQKKYNSLDSGSDDDESMMMRRGQNADPENGSQMPAMMGGVSIFHYAGLVNKQEIHLMKKLMFRASKGKVLCKVCDDQVIDYSFGSEQISLNKKTVEKCIYVLVFQDVYVLKQKTLRICDTFSPDGKRYGLPNDGQGTQADYRDKMVQLEKEISTLAKVIQMSRANICQYLSDVSNLPGSKNSSLAIAKLFIEKERSTYEALNMMQQSGTIFTGYIWSHADKQTILNQLHQTAIGNASLQIEQIKYHKLNPPTFFHTNDVTGPFQEIVNTYGTPAYGEINPAVFTCVSFPFLFGVMFGDIAHGAIVLLVGIILCASEDFIKGVEGMEMFHQTRYLVLMMGIFATYMGFIYNDFMSFPIELFGRGCYELDRDTGKFETISGQENCVYGFGFDPVWMASSQDLPVANSFKMKVSVILGIAHMSLGICMKAFNGKYFGRPYDIYHEFLPQILLLLALFGFMDLLIIQKWLTDWEGQGETARAPGIVNLIIGMFLNFGAVDYDKELPIIPQQESVCKLMLVIAMVTPPWMLFVKPLLLLKDDLDSKKKKLETSKIEMTAISQIDSDIEESNVDLLDIDRKEENELKIMEDNSRISDEEYLLEVLKGSSKKGEEEFDFGEEMIHSLIESIEFVLGTVSNTASYLRLWALSLAHGQLAKVFGEMLLLEALKTGGPFKLFIIFPIFAGVTIGVLLVMDCMECFLHVLRLHWVEFQNKFFKGTGYIFKPLDFGTQLKLQ